VRVLLLQQATVHIECYRSATVTAAAGATAVAVAVATAGGLWEHSENRCARVGRFLTLRHSVMCAVCVCVWQCERSAQQR
jgi:ABC-type spermidine/putrescine transport system permease subunit II